MISVERIQLIEFTCDPVHRRVKGSPPNQGKSNPINWRNKSGGLKPSEAKRLKQFEDENQRLKKCYSL